MRNIMKKVIFILLTVLMTSSSFAGMWTSQGIRVSNICRSLVDMNYYWVYPVWESLPVGSSCRFPNGTPGIVTDR